MKNKFLKIFLTIICSFGISLNVFAVSTPFVDDGSSTDTNGLKSKYNSTNKTNVSGTNTMVTLYGKSVCSGSSCTLTYAFSNNSSFKEALAKAVVCTNGEKYIAYLFAGSGNVNFKEDNKGELNGTAYWDEDYSVTCTSNNSGSSVVALSNDSSSSTTTTTRTANQSGQSNSSNYNTATTVDNEQTGVNTYFIVLGLVAIISYVFMLCVKKFNLFKNI